MYVKEQYAEVKSLSDIPKDERPREKLKNKGPKVLSDRELLAILIGKGRKGQDVFSLAGDILEMMDENGGFPDLEMLQTLKGIGPVKSSIIVAAVEFARRRIRPEGVKITAPSDVLPLIQHYADRKQEHLLCITLNGANEVISTRVITIGLLNRTQIHPREVFADALIDRAASIIMAHNHPSGNLSPSREDRSITRRIKESGDVLGIQLLDHLVFTLKGFYSFKEHGDI